MVLLWALAPVPVVPGREERRGDEKREREGKGKGEDAPSATVSVGWCVCGEQTVQYV